MASLFRNALSATSQEYEQTKEMVSAEQMRMQDRIDQTNDMVERSVRTYMRAAAAPSGEFGEIVERRGFLVLRSTAKLVTILLFLVLILQGVAFLVLMLDPTRFTRRLAQFVSMGVAALQVVLLVVSAQNFLVSLKDQRVHRKFMRFGIGKAVASEIADERRANRVSAQDDAGQAKQLKDFVTELTERIVREKKDTSQLFSLPRAQKLEDDIRRFRDRQAALFFGSLTCAAGVNMAAALQLPPEDEAKEPTADEMAEARASASAASDLIARQSTPSAPLERLRARLAGAAGPSAEQTAALRVVRDILLALQTAEQELVTARAPTSATKDAQAALRAARDRVRAAANLYATLNQATMLPAAGEDEPAATIRASITAAEEAALQKVFAMADLGEAIEASRAGVEPTDHSPRGAVLVTSVAGLALSLLASSTSAVFANKYYARAYLDLPKFYNEANLFLLANLDSVKASLVERIRLAELFQLTEERQRLEDIAKTSVPGGLGGLEALLANQAIAAAGYVGAPAAGVGYAGAPILPPAPVLPPPAAGAGYGGYLG